MDPVTKILFMPYALIIPHRHSWSHGPLIGTAIRAAYVTFVAYEIATIAGVAPQFVDAMIYVVSWRACRYFFGALALADVLHYICDQIGGKKRR